jgi:oligopeptide transport system substrate-binding protein
MRSVARAIHRIARRLPVLVLVCLLAAPAGAQSVLRFGLGGEADSLDPMKAELIYARALNLNMWLTLVSFDADGNMIGAAAKSWDVAPDGLTYTFHVRDDLKWSDGTPLTAADFVYTFRRMLDPKTLYNSAQLFYWIKGAQAVNAQNHPLTELGVAAPDAHTFVVTLAKPNPLFLYLAALAYCVPQKAIEKYGAAWTQAGHIVTSGAYVVKDRVPGTRIVLVKNPYSIYASSTAIDEVDVYFVGDDSSLAKRYRADELDMVYAITADEFDKMARERPSETVAFTASDTSFITLNTKRPKLADARVRRALSMLIDRNIIAQKIVGGKATPAYSLVPELWPGIDPRALPDYAGWPRDKRVSEAQSLLRAAGYTPDKPLAVEYIYYAGGITARIAIIIKSMWDQTGLIRTSLLSKEQAGLFAAFDGHDFDAGSMGIDMGLEIDPYDVLQGLEPGGWNDRSGYHSASFETLMDQVRSTANMATRARLLADADTDWTNANAILPLVHGPTRWFISPRVKGWTTKAQPYFWRLLSIADERQSAHGSTSSP